MGEAVISRSMAYLILFAILIVYMPCSTAARESDYKLEDIGPFSVKINVPSNSEVASSDTDIDCSNVAKKYKKIFFDDTQELIIIELTEFYQNQDKSDDFLNGSCTRIIETAP